MKTIRIVILLLYFSGSFINAQPWGDEKPGRFDKIIYDPALRTERVSDYTWDVEMQSWLSRNTINYEYSYDKGVINTITTIDSLSSIPLSRMIHYYTLDMILTETLFQKWDSGKWIDTRRNLWYQNEEGMTKEAIIQFFINGEWINSIRYTDYFYKEGLLTEYIYQTWRSDKWVNILHDQWFYDTDGQLVRREQIGVNGIPINKFIYMVNENKLRTDLTLYNWNSGRWLENYRLLYEHNQCGRTSSTIYQIFINGSWVNSTRQEYHYGLNIIETKPGQRIPVCHKGNTIYVSVNAVNAHLAHGDCLGECVIENKLGKKEFEDKLTPLAPPFIVYPNPARERITIKFNDDCKDSKRVELTDFYGKLIKSFNVRGNSDLTIYREKLLSGKYYVRLIGKEVYSMVVIFE